MKAFTRKPKALTSNDFGEIRAAIDLPVQTNSDVFEFLQNREPQYPVHNIEGIPVTLEGVLYRNPTSSYQLELRIGKQVYRVASIQPGKHTDAIAARMTVVGPSRSQLEAREKHARHQMWADDRAEAAYAQRREAAIKLRERREANERQRRAEAAAAR